MTGPQPENLQRSVTEAPAKTAGPLATAEPAKVEAPETSPEPSKGSSSRSGQTHLLREIVDARMESVVKRSEQINARAGMLVAAAAVSATILSTSANNGWIVLSILLTLGAATAGVITLFPRKDRYLSLPELRHEILKRPMVEAVLMHADQQIKTYDIRVKSLTRRGWLIRIGFSLLAASILARAALVLNVVVAIG